MEFVNSRARPIPFSKLHGTENSFVLFVASDIEEYLDQIARFSISVSSVGTGLGTDGVMIIHQPDHNDSEIQVDMYNPDGSEMGMCGNGIRCVFRECVRREIIAAGTSEAVFRVFGRRIVCSSEDEGRNVKVSMGKVSWEPKDIPLQGDTRLIDSPLTVVADGARTELRLSAVSMGNPHGVLFSHQDQFLKFGPLLEHHEIFPKRANIEFVTVLSPALLEVKVWERGAGATRACGTGACAALVVAATLGLAERAAQVSLPGGTVAVSWDPETDEVYLTGPTCDIASGMVYIEL